MPRANRHFLPGHVWHITHRCHQKKFLLKFARDRHSTKLRWQIFPQLMTCFQNVTIRVDDWKRSFDVHASDKILLREKYILALHRSSTTAPLISST